MIVPAGDTSAPPVVLDGIPAPITCNVSELLDGATDTVEVTTTGLGEVTLGPGDDVTVTVTDDYQPRPATLVLTKVITGDAAGQHGPIQITANCDGTTATFDIPAGVTDPAPFTIDGIAPGATCTIAEPIDGSTAAVAVSTSPALPFTVGPIPAGGTLAATITDEYTLLTGRLLVAKQVFGPAADSRGAITITVDCSDGTTASITYAPTDPLTALDVGPVPFGTTCTVTEPATGAIDDVIVDGPVFDPDAVVTIDESVEVVTVSNTYSFAPGTVELVKELDGPAAAERGTVRLRWTCDDEVTVVRDPPGPGRTGDPVRRRGAVRHDLRSRRAQQRRRLGRRRHHRLRPAERCRHGHRRRDRQGHRHQHLHPDPHRRPARREHPHRPRRAPPGHRAAHRRPATAAAP